MSIALAAPAVDASYIVGIVSRVLHILSAIILGGGIFYLRTVLAPAGDADACFAGRRQAWAKWVGMATLFLLASGIYNFYRIVIVAKEAGDKLSGTYFALLGIKVLLALLVMFLATILAGKTSAAERFRAQMSKWLNVAWAAVLAIVVIAAILRTLHL